MCVEALVEKLPVEPEQHAVLNVRVEPEMIPRHLSPANLRLRPRRIGEKRAVAGHRLQIKRRGRLQHRAQRPQLARAVGRGCRADDGVAHEIARLRTRRHHRPLRAVHQPFGIQSRHIWT